MLEIALSASDLDFKLFNEIESEISGTIIKVLVEDMSPVEYDQPLFLVDKN